MKIALVCDFLTKFGGAQQVLLAMHEIYPDAPIYCLLYDEKGTLSKFKNAKIIPSSSQKSIFAKHPKFLLPSFPKAIERFNLSEYDVVISSNDSFAHGIITKPKTFHLCYCHTPMRYAWDWYNEYLAENDVNFGLKGLIVRSIIHNIRIWDKISSDRVDHWLANSKNVRKRIHKYYQNDADVVYPPVDIDHIKPNGKDPEDFYLIVSRIEPYKRIKLAIEAFNKSGKRLIIIGDGSQLAELQSTAKKNIEFHGAKYGEDLYDYFRRAKAFIFPGEDDFGITPVESMAAGRPVVAFGVGGTRETVLEGETGYFFNEITSGSLSEAIDKLENNYDKLTVNKCRDRAEKFGKSEFQRKIKQAVEEGYKRHLSQYN